MDAKVFEEIYTAMHRVAAMFIARSYSWKSDLQIEELVNAAWLNKRKTLEAAYRKGPEILHRHISQGIISYLRVLFGVKPSKQQLEGSCKYNTLLKQCSLDNLLHADDGNFTPDRGNVDEEFELIETKEAVRFLLEHTNLTLKESFALYGYYFEGIQDRNLAKPLGCVHSSIFAARKQAVDKLKATAIRHDLMEV